MQGTIHSLNPNHPEVAAAYGNLGAVHLEIGDYSTANELFYTALKKIEVFYSDIPNHQDIALYCNNLGKSYYITGDYQKALTYATRSTNICERIPNPPIKSFHSLSNAILLQLGNCAFLKGDVEKIILWYTKLELIQPSGIAVDNFIKFCF